MSDISFSMSADEKDVTKALQNLIKENAKLRGEIQAGVNEAKTAAAQEREFQKLREKATKDAVAQMNQLNSAAAKIKDSVATPFDMAKKKVQELREHLQAGTISTDVYRKAYANVAKELKEATTDHEAVAKATKEHNDAVKQATQVAERYATKEEKVSREIERLNALKAKGVLSSKDHARAIEAESKKLAETGEAADTSGGMIGGLTTKMTAFVGGLTSAGAVIAFLKSEYDALIERQGKSRDANISLAAEQEALLMNLGDASAKDVTGQIRTMSKQSGVKEENLTRAVNESMAARGDLNVTDVMAAVGTAAKVRKFAPSELSGLAAATIDTQKQTGLGTDASLGFLMQLQAQSRTKSLKGLAENFTPAVGGVMNFGADRQTAGAMLAALSHGMGDTSGAATGTSAIQLAKQLREFGGGKDIGETIGNLQNDKGMREKFLAGASFEAKALPAIESLLSGGTQAQQFSAARKALSSDPTETLKQAIGNRDLPAMIIAGEDQALGNMVDQQKLDDIEGARAAIYRDRIKQMRDQAGNLGLSTTAKGITDDLVSGGGMTPGQAIRAIQREVDELKSGKTAGSNAVKSFLGEGALGLGVAAAMESRTASSDATKKQVEFLQQLVDLTKQQLEANNQKAHAGIVANRAANPENK